VAKQEGNKKVIRYFRALERLMDSGRTLRDVFDISTESFPKMIAAEYYDEKGKHHRLRYFEYRSESFVIAGQLHQLLLALPRGAVVGLKIKNCPVWGELFWAILMNGRVPFLLDARASGAATAAFIKEADARAVITDDGFSYEVPHFSVADIRSQIKDYTFAAEWENHVVFATSGTTGAAKLVVFDGTNLVHQINSARDMPNATAEIMYPPSLGNLKVLALIPFHHIFGFVAVFLWYTFFGKTIVYLDSFLPKAIKQTCQDLRVTHIFAVPLFWDNMAQGIHRSALLQGPERVRTLDKAIAFHTGKISRAEAGVAGSGVVLRSLQKKILGNHVRFCISGGGALAQDTIDAINGIGYPLYDGYGLTEVGVTSVELSPSVEQRLKGSIGKPFHGMEYKIVPSDGRPNVGELLIKSPTTHGFEIVDKKLIPTVLDEGWFPTGDIAENDKAGFYWIKGRLKDLIINANGENVYPEEIENRFISIERVSNAAVLGIKKSSDSEKETITLILELDGKLDESSLSALKAAVKNVNVTLPNYMQVEETLIYDGILPLSSALKVQKFVLRDQLTGAPERFAALPEARLANFSKYPPELINDILPKVRKAFSNALLLPVYKLSDAGHFVHDFGGDSLSYMSLINDLEDEFGIKIENNDFGHLTSIDDFVEEIAKHQTSDKK
jgi:acyl carrier protein